MQSQTLTGGLRKNCVPVIGTEATWNGNVCIHATENTCLFAFALKPALHLKTKHQEFWAKSWNILSKPWEMLFGLQENYTRDSSYNLII